MRNKLRERQNEGGFTLIELLIVIIVLGILAGLVVFGVSTFRGDADKTACKSNAKGVEVASVAFTAKSTATPAAVAANVAALIADGLLQNPAPTQLVAAPPGDAQFSFADGVVTRGTNCGP